VRTDLDSLPPLQRFDLGELKFVGVIWGPAFTRALVEDGEGKGYTVTVGTRIGNSGGVVTRITDAEIVVREEFRDYTGGKVQRESSLTLQTSGGKR
jgi:type IV pilus assembly protein PilP